MARVIRKIGDGYFGTGVWYMALEIEDTTNTCTASIYINDTGREIQFGITHPDFQVVEYLPPGVAEESRAEFPPEKQASMNNCNTSLAVPSLR